MSGQIAVIICNVTNEPWFDSAQKGVHCQIVTEELLPGVAPNLNVHIYILLQQLVFHAKNGPVPIWTRTGFFPESSPNPRLCTLNYQSFEQLYYFKSEACKFVLASDISIHWAKLLTITVAKSMNSM